MNLSIQSYKEQNTAKIATPTPTPTPLAAKVFWINVEYGENPATRATAGITWAPYDSLKSLHNQVRTAHRIQGDFVLCLEHLGRVLSGEDYEKIRTGTHPVVVTAVHLMVVFLLCFCFVFFVSSEFGMPSSP